MSQSWFKVPSLHNGKMGRQSQKAPSSARLSKSDSQSLAALAGVWATNFFVVLPIVGAAFIHLVPYAISLSSKLLFGAAAAEVVRNQALFAAPPTALARFKCHLDKTCWN
jgi:hypothetical protein